MMEFNATPLVDVIFLLTIFFMLVARFSSAEQVPMELPQPEKSQARVTPMPERVVINCRLGEPRSVSEGSQTVVYSIGPNRPEPLAVIAERLMAMRGASPDIKVVLRADRRLTYADVRPVMDVIADLGIGMLNVVAHTAEDH